MNETRSTEKPLILGDAKADIGHSGAASGIFATTKAALMTEKAEIPGVYGFKKLNPNIKDKEWNIRIATDLMPWPAEFEGEHKAAANYTYNDASLDRPFLFTTSAHDQKTLVRNIKAHQDITSDYYIPDLAYTLNEGITRLAGTRSYTVVWPGRESEALLSESFVSGSKLSQKKGAQFGIGFVLTGRGARWARMGYEAMQQFPLYSETIDALALVLQRVIEPTNRPLWSLREVLEASAESSMIGQSDISQPACTAVQIAVIDLFVSWGITPAVTVGHSSSEIAAAYSAGRISAPEAVLAAYFRDRAVARAAPTGTMLAVDLGASKQPRHDVLGRRIFGLSSNAPTWKNMLHQRDASWFPHHVLDTDAVFPATDHAPLAIKALLQQVDLDPAETGGLVSQSGTWTRRSSGKIRAKQTRKKQNLDCPYKPTQLRQRVSLKRWYRSLNRVGFRIKVYTKQAELESRYMLHPSTIDGCLHVAIAAVHKGLHKEMPWGVIPLTIGDMSITFPDAAGDLDVDCIFYAWVNDDANSNRHFWCNTQSIGGNS
ncbi:hypothetical protein DL770_009575 [Monosporascus sp. CRB-9-2]|nr:hypothetical protein DL770_009575 [Monosporascus sp. CRB-9-2]